MPPHKAAPAPDPTIVEQLERRLGRLHAKLRLGLEADHEAQIFGQGTNYFHFENLKLSHAVVQTCFKVAGLYQRGRRNAARPIVRETSIYSNKLPRDFDGFTILHLSDLHVEMSANAMSHVCTLLASVDYDICVLTGDYRAQTFGPYEAALSGTERVCCAINKPMYGVLGNHDTIHMLPGLEEMNVRMLMNENVAIERGTSRIYIAGIDDAHFYCADNLEKAAAGVAPNDYSILLSHTPEVYRQAAHAEFDLMLSGHTHGGQVCLPGSIPITLASVLPRRFGAGLWKYHNLTGYTSVGAGTCIAPVRFNCPPEITLHHLHSVPKFDR
jgi:predicted MPP superfamily phosphohydrolase